MPRKPGTSEILIPYMRLQEKNALNRHALSYGFYFAVDLWSLFLAGVREKIKTRLARRDGRARACAYAARTVLPGGAKRAGAAGEPR